MGSRIKAIIFDLDDTLIADQDVLPLALLAACGRVSPDFGSDEEALLAHLRSCARPKWVGASMAETCESIGISWWEALEGDFAGDDALSVAIRSILSAYRQSAWQDFVVAYDLPHTEAQRIGSIFITERRARRQPYAETHAVLEELSDLRLAMLTNGHSGWQRMKAEMAGVDHAFDPIVVSGDVGIGKPHEAVFQAVLKELGAHPEEVVMVGNSLPKDIEGAQAAGIRGIWINRPGALNETECVPFAEARDLAEAAAIVRGIAE